MEIAHAAKQRVHGDIQAYLHKLDGCFSMETMVSPTIKVIESLAALILPNSQIEIYAATSESKSQNHGIDDWMKKLTAVIKAKR